MNDHTKRRKRRRAKAKLLRLDSVRRHQRQAGRTGRIHSRKTPSQKPSGYQSREPNPPPQAWANIARRGEST